MAALKPFKSPGDFALIRDAYRDKLVCLASGKRGAGVMEKWRLFVALSVLVMGLAALINSLGNPRLAGLNGTDIGQIGAVGFCIGLAFGVLLGARNAAGKSSIRTL